MIIDRLPHLSDIGPRLRTTAVKGALKGVVKLPYIVKDF